MAEQMLLFTVLPYGKVSDGGVHDGQWRVTAVVSPRLTPQSASEQKLDAFPEWLDWPETLRRAKFSLIVGGDGSELIPLTKADSALWAKLFTPNTPVNGFQFKDMSKVNMHSYPVKNVLGFARKHYGRLAVKAADSHPRLLPWDDVNPDLKGMLAELGTTTRTIPFNDQDIEILNPGFSRFYEQRTDKNLEEMAFNGGFYKVQVPAPDAELTQLPGTAATIQRRAMSPDWADPALGGPDAALMGQFSSADEYNFYQADRFYRRDRDPTPTPRYPTFTDISPPPPIPEYDFHRIVASFANYGELLRRLGLLIDFAVEDSALLNDLISSNGGHAIGQCQLKVSWDGAAPGEIATPRTAWEANKERFWPRPRGPGQEGGLLKLKHSNDGWGIVKSEQEGLFDVYQVDPDGLALKTVNFTLTAQNLVGKSLQFDRKDGAITYTTGDRQAVAALRSGGMGVSQHGRAETVITDAAAADLKNQEIMAGNADKVVLFAEDVFRGYRIDVARVEDSINPGKWHSLCARVGEWRLLKADEKLQGMLGDEGYVSGASTISSGEDDEHYLHESLFRWHGWSLVASRPGRTIVSETNDDDNLQAEVPRDVTEVAENGNGVAVSFSPKPRSLPRLRFGQLYRFRARLVDLAGNSLALDDASIGELEQASDAVGYWRMEPVDPPVLVNRERVSEGESLERMVIRSNFDVNCEDYLTTPDFSQANSQEFSADFTYTAINERHVVPPKSSQQQCETHGFFDPFFGDWELAKKGYEIAAREDGTLFDETPDTDIEFVTPKALANVATSTDLPIELPSADNPVGDRTAGGQYIVHHQARIDTPWLADGSAGGTVIRAASGHEIPGVSPTTDPGDGCEVIMAPNGQLVLRIPRGEEWPYCDGFRIILAERIQSHDELPCNESFADAGEPKWDNDARTLTLFVSKGRIVRLRYSSYVEKSMIFDFGIPYWAPTSGQGEEVRESAMAGCNWMITPYRNLTLVHAVQQPVCLPEIVKLDIQRQTGALHADLRSRLVRLHGPSTGKFEIEAKWHEWVDDINNPEPERRHFKGQLGEVSLAENHPNEFALAQAVNDHRTEPEGARGDRHELGDTRFRLIQYRARATTRFREYLPPPLYDQPDKTSRLGPVADGPGYALPNEDDAGAPVLRDGNGSTEQSLVVASAPPKDPRVLYVVPTFRWGDRPESGPHDVTRLGNGLRVWLDRPWFSSGDGELLGVIINQNNGKFDKIPEERQSLVTQWGLDPLWSSPSPRNRTRRQDFPARVHSESVDLQETPADAKPGSDLAKGVEVIGHRVHWDANRALWYCDIELEAGTNYMPFVRLALVRYQPNALKHAKISKVVVAEFAQVLPRRRLRVYRDGNQLNIALHGPNPLAGPMKYNLDSAFHEVSFANEPMEYGRNRVEVVLQEQDDGIDSDMGWRDVKVLSESIVGQSGATSANPGGVFGPTIDVIAERISGGGTRGGSRTIVRRAGGSVIIPSVMERGRFNPANPFGRDTAFWSDEVTLPNGDGKQRILVREFERFYSDSNAPQRVGNQLFTRRIVEERLVFADIVDPQTLD